MDAVSFYFLDPSLVLGRLLPCRSVVLSSFVVLGGVFRVATIYSRLFCIGCYLSLGPPRFPRRLDLLDGIHDDDDMEDRIELVPGL